MKLKTLFEAKPTKTKIGVDSSLDSLFNQGTQKPIATTPNRNGEVNTQQRPVVNNRVASRQQTKDKMKNVSMPQHNMSINHDEIDQTGEISNQQAAQNAGLSNDNALDPTTPQSLPAIIKHSMEVSTGTEVDIDWHMVKQLPGYMSSAIRAMGRQVFAPFTSTAIEDIQVLANLNGSGPNSDQEIDAISKYVSGAGEPNVQAELFFSKVIPGYSAKVVAFDCDGYTFLLVKDFAGKYVYSWPAADSKKLTGNNNQQLSNERKRLR